jgi:hypothetical protein
MIDETLETLLKRIEDAPSIQTEKKEELLSLLSTLRSEIGELNTTSRTDAETITALTDDSISKVAESEADEDGLLSAADKLKRSVENFEASHPKLFETVNAISTTLSNMGI